VETTKTSPRERLLATARRLFYAEGIHSVGVDRLVSEANVTRATFYRHFPAKDNLVEAYLRATDADLREAVGAAIAGGDPEQSLSALLDLIGHTTAVEGFRGCHFINAAAEFPDGSDPIRIAIDDHRAWFQQVVTQLAANIGHPDPDYAGRVLVLLHDGALSAAQLDDAEAVGSTVKRAAREVLGIGRLSARGAAASPHRPPDRPRS
jgi:AcrR family transcriptional regulator